MILGYFLFIYSYIATDLLNKCKMYNIKDTDCINSSFIPSSEYNKYLQSFNMPVIRDDYCIQNKCVAVVSNESVSTNNNVIQTVRPISTNNNIIQTVRPISTPKITELPKVNLTTFTSTTTSTVKISFVPIKKENTSPVVCLERDRCIEKEENTKEKDCDEECEEIKKSKKIEKKSKEKDCDEECEEIKKSKKIEKNSKIDKDVSSIITVTREIPTTITVDVPLTLYREFTTTSIEKVPIVNYELTTYTKSLISTETVYKTSTTVLTSEIIKTTTLTTEVEKTTTFTTAVEKTTTITKTETIKSEEPKKEEPKKEEPKKEEPKREEPKREEPKKEKPNKSEEEDYKFPGFFKNLLKEETTTRQNTDKILTSTVYLTKAPDIKTENITTVTVSTTITAKSPVESKPVLSTTVSKKEENTKKEENCEIIPLLKELLKAKTTIRKRRKEIKPKKTIRTIYRTVYAKKKKEKCSTIKLGEDPCEESTEL